MAITTTKIAGEHNSSSEMQFLIDTEADIENLPIWAKECMDIDCTMMTNGMSGDENGYKK